MKQEILVLDRQELFTVCDMDFSSSVFKLFTSSAIGATMGFFFGGLALSSILQSKTVLPSFALATFVGLLVGCLMGMHAEWKNVCRVIHTARILYGVVRSMPSIELYTLLHDSATSLKSVYDRETAAILAHREFESPETEQELEGARSYIRGQEIAFWRYVKVINPMEHLKPVLASGEKVSFKDFLRPPSEVRSLFN